MLSGALRWRDHPGNRFIDDPDLRAAWDCVNAKGADTPLLAADTVAAALRVFGRGDERILLGSCSDRPEAMLLLQPCGFGRWQTFQPSQLPLGAWVATAGLPPHELARQVLTGPLRQRALLLSLTQVDPLFTVRATECKACSSLDYVETGWIDLDGCFDEYWAARSKNLRANVRKQNRHLAESGIACDLTVYRTPDEMTDAVARYGELESGGWKGREGTAVHRENDQGKFYRELLQLLATRGEAAVYELRFNGKTVASNLCLDRGNTLIVLKTAYDETVDKKYSPAILLRHAQLQTLFEGGRILRLEYYGRFREWQSQWTQEKRMLFHLTCCRWPWLELIRRKIRCGIIHWPSRRPVDSSRA